MFSVHVKASTHEGWGELRGMLHFSEGKLRLQHQSKDAVLGLLTSRAREQEVSLELLHRVEYHGGFLGLFPKIQLHFSDFIAASTLPGTDAGVMTLGIPWRERVRAKDLAGHAETARALLRAMQLEKDIAHLSSADPLTALRDAVPARKPSAWLRQVRSSE